MPRTKKAKAGGPLLQPKTRRAAKNGTPDDVLTLVETAAYLRLAEAEVVGLVQSQGLPGRLVGDEWRFLKSAVQDWLASGTASWQTRKASILELAGKYKDDPDLEQIVEDAYRRRGRPITENGSYKNFSG